MGVSLGCAKRHIEEWTNRLRRFPQNANWPKYLFHTTHVETAVQILRSDRLLCRNSIGHVAHDVANRGALLNNPEPHDYARLYFRPKNQFHLKTEGIKCIGDPYRAEHHMSIPVVLAFDAQTVLTLEGAGFSAGKLSVKRPIEFDEAYFGKIPFDLVYHDGPLPRDEVKRVNDYRMAEIVVRGELPLVPHLKLIICRTSLDRKTLLHLLGSDASRFRAKTTVEQVHGSVFMHKGLYIRKINATDKVVLDFHLPSSPPPSGRIEVEIAQWVGSVEVDRRWYEVPSDRASVSFEDFRVVPSSTWQIHVEGVLAFDAEISSETSVLVR